MEEKHISTSIWSAQLPNAGQKSMNGYFGSTKAAIVGIIQVAEAPEKAYHYLIPLLKGLVKSTLDTASNMVCYTLAPI